MMAGGVDGGRLASRTLWATLLSSVLVVVLLAPLIVLSIASQLCGSSGSSDGGDASYGSLGDAPARRGDYSWMCQRMKVCRSGDKGAYAYANFPRNGYQCTWYAWMRLAMLHGVKGWTTGSADSWHPQAEANGGDIWKRAQGLPGWSVDSTPHPGDGASGWASGGIGSYGHVAVVEEVASDPSGYKVRISEGNLIGPADGGVGCIGGSYMHGCWNGYRGDRWMTKAQMESNGVHFFRYATWSTTGKASDAKTAKPSVSFETPVARPAAERSVSASTPSVVGWDEAKAMARFGGQQGPGGVCAPYAFGQCTWWACMREFMIGNTVGSYWGNGQDWVNSAAANGWKRGVVAPGGVVSFAGGSTDRYADGSPGYTHSGYGHVAVIESVDTGSRTFTTSEKGAGVTVYSHTYSYSPLPSNMSVAAPPGTKGETAVGGSVSGGTSQSASSASQVSCKVAGADTDGSDTDGVDASYKGDGRHATPAQAKAIARQLLPKYFPDNHGADQWDCLVWVWNHESDWQWNADNPTSDAYGIPQALPGSKMASAGPDWHDNAGTQIKWGLGYIRERYGSPCQAKTFWLANNWY